MEVVTSDIWEQWFSVADADPPPCDAPERCDWVIYDAECAFVCRCATEENAKAVQAALNAHKREDWR